MTGSAAGHWDAAYSRGQENLSWFQDQAEVSLELLQAAGSQPSDAVVDVGGGASVLVWDLVQRGYRDVTVLDVSAAALEASRSRFGQTAPVGLQWLEADLLQWVPERVYDVWHDRAVLHFLVEDDDVAAYFDRVRAATAAGSLVVIGVFGPDGPTACSGLPTKRYTAPDLMAQMGPGFRQEAGVMRVHTTPGGGRQQFQWVAARRV